VKPLSAARLAAVAEMSSVNLKDKPGKGHTCTAAWKPVRGENWAAERDEADQKEND
jgi:hypothetical protein